MATPALGYGQRASAPIDAFNQWLRAQPQYQSLIRSFGQDPANVHLNDAQKQEVVRLAQSLGAVVDEGNNGQEVDESGNFRKKGHALRNTLIVAGIAAAALATAGIATAIAGPAAGGAAASTGAASTAAGLGGVEAGVTAGLGATALPGALATLPGLSSAGAGLAGLAGGLGGVEAGAQAGLGAAALPGAGTALDAGSALAGAAPGWDAAGNFIGDSTVTGDAGVGTGSKLASLASNLGKLGNSASSILNNGQDPALAGISSANAAAQEARNRLLGAQVDQGGPAADKTALSNMRTAGLMANFKDAPASPYGSPAISVDPSTRSLASAFQQELLKRQAAGKSLTASGVPDPSAQELADEQRARDVANGKSGVPGVAGQVINGINTGARIANLAPGIIKGARDIWSLF